MRLKSNQLNAAYLPDGKMAHFHCMSKAELDQLSEDKILTPSPGFNLGGYYCDRCGKPIE